VRRKRAWFTTAWKLLQKIVPPQIKHEDVIPTQTRNCMRSQIDTALSRHITEFALTNFKPDGAAAHTTTQLRTPMHLATHQQISQGQSTPTSYITAQSRCPGYHPRHWVDTPQQTKVFSSNPQPLQIISYLHVGGMTTWFYAVMTIFAQRFNICSANFGERPRLFPPSVYAPMATVNDGYVVLTFSL